MNLDDPLQVAQPWSMDACLAARERIFNLEAILVQSLQNRHEAIEEQRGLRTSNQNLQNELLRLQKELTTTQLNAENTDAIMEQQVRDEVVLHTQLHHYWKALQRTMNMGSTEDLYKRHGLRDPSSGSASPTDQVPPETRADAFHAPPILLDLESSVSQDLWTQALNFPTFSPDEHTNDQDQSNNVNHMVAPNMEPTPAATPSVVDGHLSSYERSPTPTPLIPLEDDEDDLTTAILDATVSCAPAAYGFIGSTTDHMGSLTDHTANIGRVLPSPIVMYHQHGPNHGRQEDPDAHDKLVILPMPSDTYTTSPTTGSVDPMMPNAQSTSLLNSLAFAADGEWTQQLHGYFTDGFLMNVNGGGGGGGGDRSG